VTSPATRQRSFEDVTVGEELAPVVFPLTVYRLVVAAGGNRDFNSIHHNTAYAQASGAPEMYASTFVLMGMWERLVRDYIGPAGTIRSIKDFRMRKFNLVGSTVQVRGRVRDKRPDGDRGIVTLDVESVVDGQVTVGPGTVEVTMPATSATGRWPA
jgi:acyl dehydratase